MGKGEIARHEQFLLFSQCFQKACFPGVSKGVIVWEWVNPSSNSKFLDRPNLKEVADDKINVTEKLKFVLRRVENTVGKGENAGYHSIFSFSPQWFQKASFQGYQKLAMCGTQLTWLQKYKICVPVQRLLWQHIHNTMQVYYTITSLETLTIISHLDLSQRSTKHLPDDNIQFGST